MIDAHPGRLSVAAVRALSPYVPGKPVSELERELGIHDVIKLASNENPWGPSPVARAAMQRAMDQIWLYPDGSGHELKHALAQHLGIGAEHLTLGNGSNDLLVLLCEAFLEQKASAVYSQYGFSIYPLVIKATGARAIEVPALPSTAAMPLGHDLPAMIAAIEPGTRLLFIANPNNPTGTWSGPAELHNSLRQVPRDTLIVLDEAYFEYARHHGCQDGLQWTRAMPNLVLLRTFSKAYGLAGLRAGYAISHPEVAEVLNRLRPPFNVNSMALAAAAAALVDQDHVRQVTTTTYRELQRVRTSLGQMGLSSLPSAANFLLVKVGADARGMYQRLLRQAIIVRPVDSYGLDEYLRISIGTPEQNQRLLDLMAAEVRAQ